MTPAPRPILLAPPALRAQVRSQTVIGSVAEALAEVVANALDAGAGEINIELALGQDSLGFRVADTGHGVPAASMALLGQRFATSKRPGAGAGSQAAAPLLGYRGEALAAIREAAAAVEVTSRAAGSFETLAVTLRPGGQASQPALALEQRTRQGTAVVVRGLYAGQPVRRKALLMAGCVGRPAGCFAVRCSCTCCCHSADCRALHALAAHHSPPPCPLPAGCRRRPTAAARRCCAWRCCAPTSPSRCLTRRAAPSCCACSGGGRSCRRQPTSWATRRTCWPPWRLPPAPSLL